MGRDGLALGHRACRRWTLSLERRWARRRARSRAAALIADADGEPRGRWSCQGPDAPQIGAREGFPRGLGHRAQRRAAGMSLAMQAELYRRARSPRQATEGALDIEGGLPDLASAGVSAAAAASARCRRASRWAPASSEKGSHDERGVRHRARDLTDGIGYLHAHDELNPNLGCDHRAKWLSYSPTRDAVLGQHAVAPDEAPHTLPSQRSTHRRRPRRSCSAPS